MAAAQLAHQRRPSPRDTRARWLLAGGLQPTPDLIGVVPESLAFRWRASSRISRSAQASATIAARVACRRCRMVVAGQLIGLWTIVIRAELAREIRRDPAADGCVERPLLVEALIQAGFEQQRVQCVDARMLARHGLIVLNDVDDAVADAGNEDRSITDDRDWDRDPGFEALKRRIGALGIERSALIRAGSLHGLRQARARICAVCSRQRLRPSAEHPAACRRLGSRRRFRRTIPSSSRAGPRCRTASAWRWVTARRSA